MKKKLFALVTVVSLMFFVFGCGGSKQASPEDAKLTPATWTVDTMFGSVVKCGVLVENTADVYGDFKVVAEFYDDDENYIDTQTNSGALKAGGKWFYFFHMEDGATNVKYSVEEANTLYEPVSDEDATFRYDEKQKQMIFVNGTDKEIDVCSFQYVFYKNGKIVDVVMQSVHDGDVPANKKVMEPFTIESESDYDRYELLTYALQ